MVFTLYNVHQIRSDLIFGLKMEVFVCIDLLLAWFIVDVKVTYYLLF